MAAGFVAFHLTRHADLFNGAPQASSAEEFGTVGVSFRARKAAHDDEWAATLAALGCAVPARTAGAERGDAA